MRWFTPLTGNSREFRITGVESSKIHAIFFPHFPEIAETRMNFLPHFKTLLVIQISFCLSFVGPYLSPRLDFFYPWLATPFYTLAYFCCMGIFLRFAYCLCDFSATISGEYGCCRFLCSSMRHTPFWVPFVAAVYSHEVGGTLPLLCRFVFFLPYYAKLVGSCTITIYNYAITVLMQKFVC